MRARIIKIAPLAALCLLGCNVTGSVAQDAGTATLDASEESAMASRHHTKKGFRNNYAHERHGAGDFLKFLAEFRDAPAPQQFPMATNDPAYLQSNRSERTITWIGHDSFLIQVNGLNLLTDPHFTERASPVGWAGPARMMPPGLALAQLPHIDAVLISHNHYDHLDERSVLALQQRQADKPPRYYVPLGVKAWFTAREINNVVELDWWQSADFGGTTFHALPVQHFSGRGPFDRNATLWCGWAVQWPDYSLFFAGDSGYSKDFRDIGERFGGFDLSLIPIGAYDPRWFMRAMHVDPEEAVQIHRDVKSRRSIGMHWGSFVLTTEDPSEPPRRLEQAVRSAGLAQEEFSVMQHGETRWLDQEAGSLAESRAVR
jgi:N-acyl-phosphatidylethanolamine-hydrolysing phospholipase D